MTDNDTIHDPTFLQTLRTIYKTSSKNEQEKLPIGLFNSIFHNQPENIIHENDLISIRKTCPGVSQCFNRSMISRIVKFIDENPVYETLYGFDYYWPASLGIPFLQTKTSYLELLQEIKMKRAFIRLFLIILWMILIEIEPCIQLPI